MTAQARGTFEVTVTPEPPYDAAPGATLGRVVISKQFHGGLEGSSRVDMLSVRSQVQGSAGYVAIERVTGKLQGRSGTFVLQHSGTMNRGKVELMVSVVPDSATEQLQGLAGRMTIDIVEGKHFYTFDYTLDASA